MNRYSFNLVKHVSNILGENLHQYGAEEREQK